MTSTSEIVVQFGGMLFVLAHHISSQLLSLSDYDGNSRDKGKTFNRFNPLFVIISATLLGGLTLNIGARLCGFVLKLFESVSEISWDVEETPVHPRDVQGTVQEFFQSNRHLHIMSSWSSVGFLNPVKRNFNHGRPSCGCCGHGQSI